MSGKDTPYRLLQTCHFSSTPRIGGFSSVSRVLFSAAIRACPRADRSPSVSPRVATRIDGAPRALGNCHASSPLLVCRSGIGRAADRGRLSVSTSCSGHVSGSRRRFERPFGQRAIRPLVLVEPRDAIADNPSDTSCRAVPVFRRRPCQDRFSPRRVNDESFFGPRCLPSMSASLVRAACAATSANPPATSARFCHRTSASGAPFSPLLTACAVHVRPTPASVIPEPGYPFRPSSRTFRSEPSRQGGGASLVDFCNHWFRSASTTSGSLDSPPTRYRVSIVVFLRAGRHRALAGAEAFRRSLHAVTGLLPPSQGPAVAFACASRVAPSPALSRLLRCNSIATPTAMSSTHLSSQSTW